MDAYKYINFTNLNDDAIGAENTMSFRKHLTEPPQFEYTQEIRCLPYTNPSNEPSLMVYGYSKLSSQEDLDDFINLVKEKFAEHQAKQSKNE